MSTTQQLMLNHIIIHIMMGSTPLNTKSPYHLIGDPVNPTPLNTKWLSYLIGLVKRFGADILNDTISEEKCNYVMDEQFSPAD